MAQHDNKTYEQKVRLRENLRGQLEKSGPLSIMETHGGWGRLWQRCYQDVTNGVVFESDPSKCCSLAVQRPTWSVYESKAEDSIASGIGFHCKPNLFDLDPYGEPWPVLDAICGHYSQWGQGPAGFVVNDGLRQKLQIGGGWSVGSMSTAVAEFGNHNLFKRYLEVCRFIVDIAAEKIGRRVKSWAGYYANQKMTHYAFILS